MVTRKKVLTSLASKLLFLYLAIFSFGQLIRINYTFWGVQIRIHPADIVALLALILVAVFGAKMPKVFRYIKAFTLIAAFSLLFSLTRYRIEDVAIGALYLLRFTGYTALFLLAWNLVVNRKVMKNTLFNSLIIVSLFTGIFGWIQYFWLPDLRDLKYIGWDDHLYRLVGTFLDPGFTSIILVLGFFATLVTFLKKKDKLYLLAAGFFLVTTAFTYARAAYIASFVGLFYLALSLRFVKWTALGLLVLFLFAILFLPRPAGEGVRLIRTASILARAQNLKETFEIIQEEPLLGVGFNNLCAARREIIGGGSYESHACAGADTSLLFVVATTGVIGFLVFLNMAIQILRSINKDLYGTTFLVSSIALFTHSLFVNSLFYPWVMGWMGILLAISLRRKV